MDYRNRKYYLVKLNESTLSWECKNHDDYGDVYENSMRHLRKVPSIRFGRVMNHFRNPKNTSACIENDAESIEFRPQLMLSIKTEYEKRLTSAFSKMKKRNRFFEVTELTKNKCGQ